MDNSCTILIVEDNEMSLKMAKSLLELAGYKTLEADNANLGIQLAKQHQPNLILMDMHLPIKSGYEASSELKADPQTVNIPIVAFTALAMQEEQQRALANGCAGIISKPIDIKQFSKTVATFLNTSKPRLDEPGILGAFHPSSSEDLSDGVHCVNCAESKKLKQDLEEFLFHVSHDLQGPLRKIQQFSKFIEHPEEAAGSEDEKQVYLQGITRSVQEMERLLKSLMTLSRVNYRGGPLIEISLDEMVKCALLEYRQSIQDCGAQVEVGELGFIQADSRQMQMVFEELLGNALKFQAKGQQPVIRIRGTVLDNALYEITVEDNGIGLAGCEPERIFKPFQRLNSASRFPGDGMGLAIVSRIVERHGGTIRAQSKPDLGTLITIQLPLAPQSV